MSRKPKPLRFLLRDRSRHGKIRLYFSAPGARRVRIHVDEDHPDFLAHFQAARDGHPLPPPGQERKEDAPAEGSLLALVDSYSRSAAFRALRPQGQRSRLAILHACCAEIWPGNQKPIGRIAVAWVEPKHVKFLQDCKAGLPGAANNRVKYLRVLFSWASEGSAQPHNPAAAVKMLDAKRRDGHPAWSLKDVARYEQRHPVGTTARLALDLALYTAARRSDLVRLGPENVGDDGWLSFHQSKTGGLVEIPIVDELALSIAATRTGATAFLITSRGKPFTANGIGNAFHDWCGEAGLVQRGLHGLRKAAASTLAELGCGDEEIKAITGHATSNEVRRYTRSAQRRLMAASAMKRLQDSLKKSHPVEGER